MNPRSAGAQRVGLLRRLGRRAVSRWGAVMLLLVLLVLGASAVVWWLGLKQGLRGDGRVSAGLVSFRCFDAAGLVCFAGGGLWLLLLALFGARGQPFFPGARSWHFGLRTHQRIFEGRPIEPGLLRAYGAFGAVGFTLGLAITLKLAAALGWQDPAITKDQAVLGPGLLALAVLLFSGRLFRDVLFLSDFDYFVGDKAREFAEALIELEKQEAEAEREQERRTIGFWPNLILMGGLIGGGLLAFRWLGEKDGVAAFQASVSGLIVSAAGLYLLKTKPRRWRLWLALVTLATSGYLVFTQLTWGTPLRCQLLGVLWGAVVGTISTLLYLRQVNSKPRR
jgi:hypothetical protein